MNSFAYSVPDARLAGPRFHSPRLHGLDTLRSLAIVAVMIFHFWGFGGENSLPAWIEPIAKCGWMGVDLFFVLSGYLIGSQLLKPYAAGERPGLWAFYRNRLYRILPAYLAVLAAYYWVPGWSEFDGMTSPWRYLTFTFNLFLPSSGALAFSHVWSLCVEEHFYLLLPLIVLVLMRKPSLRKAAVIIASIFLFGVATRAFFLFHSVRPAFETDGFGRAYMAHIYYPTYSRLDGLLAGVTLAVLRIFRPVWWQKIARRGHLLTLAAVGLVALAVWLTHDRFNSVTGTAAVGDVVGFPILALGLACLVASSISNNGVLSRWKIPGARLIATLAFTLYLTSKALIHIVDLCFPHLHETSMWGRLAVYVAFCLITAGALHLCVERPFLWLRDRQRASVELALSQ